MTLSDLEQPTDRHYALFHTERQLLEPIVPHHFPLSGNSLVFGNIWFRDDARYLCGSWDSFYYYTVTTNYMYVDDDEIAYFTVRWKTRASFVYRLHVYGVHVWYRFLDIAKRFPWAEIQNFCSGWLLRWCGDVHVTTCYVSVSSSNQRSTRKVDVFVDNRQTSAGQL